MHAVATIKGEEISPGCLVCCLLKGVLLGSEDTPSNDGSAFSEALACEECSAENTPRQLDRVA